MARQLPFILTGDVVRTPVSLSYVTWLVTLLMVFSNKAVATIFR